MSDIHSCSYFCILPQCIEAQRDSLRERVAELEADAARYRWLRDRVLAADFNYNGSDETVLVFEIPRDMQISGNLDKTIDAAMKG